jgi:hypothetical protein
MKTAIEYVLARVDRQKDVEGDRDCPTFIERFWEACAKMAEELWKTCIIKVSESNLKALLGSDRRNGSFLCSSCLDMSLIPHVSPSRQDTQKGWLLDHWQLPP